MDCRRRLIRTITLLAAGLLPLAAANAETPKGVWFTGGTVSDNVSAYAGVLHALPGDRLGKGFALRAGANAGAYEYDSGATAIDAKYAGGEVALVYQASGPWGWANVSAGPRYTHTSLSPNDAANDRSGSRWDIGLQTDGALDGRQWRLGWQASFGPFDEAYQARAQLSRKFTAHSLRIGVEGGVQGDPSYRKTAAGAFVATAIGRDLELQLGSGVSIEHGRSARAYGSIGLSRVF